VTAGPTTTATCPSCGADRIPGATFCEACAFEFTDVAPGGDPAASTAGPPDGGVPPAQSFPDAVAVEAAATPVTAPRGEESPLDVGWTGPVTSNASRRREPNSPDSPATEGAPCKQCSDGHYLEGYCDTCGAKQPDPRDHYAEAPAPWVAGVCAVASALKPTNASKHIAARFMTTPRVEVPARSRRSRHRLRDLILRSRCDRRPLADHDTRRPQGHGSVQERQRPK